MLELRFHGRGGQGVVVLTKLVARMFFMQGKEVKEFPKFGVERRGAPVEGYVRVDERAIELNCQVYNPHAIVVMAEALLDNTPVTGGLAPGSLVLVDSARPPSALVGHLAGYRVATVDAAGIALGHGLGTPLAPVANTSLFGAFAKLWDVPFDVVEKVLRAELKKPDRNIAAARMAYERVNKPEQLLGVAVKVTPPQPLFKSMEDLPDLARSDRDARSNRTGRWRATRPNYVFKIAPCNSQCPAGNDVRGFLEALSHDDANKALAILLETSPFPGVCGRVCPHPCEAECNRTSMDGAVSVMALERHAAAHGTASFEPAPKTGWRVAIVGAGPAGLSAAWQLARRGHRVKVFEAAPHPGGMLLLGIPAFRLPREVLTEEISRIVSLGVEIQCNTEVGRSITLDGLQKEYDAVLIATGQPVSARLGLVGEDKPGVEHGLEMLRRHNLGQEVAVGERVVVIGGGNTAIDVAGVALRRSKTRQVTIVYRRTRAQMPAIAEEVGQVLAEGAALMELVAPVEARFDGAGRVVGLVCDRMRLDAPDKSGRPKAVVVPDSRFELPCDQVFLATGQSADLAFAKGLDIHVDKMHTSVPRVFTCGDASTSEGTVTAAIGSGRRAALLIHEFLGGRVAAPKPTWAPKADEVLREERINPNYFPHAERGEQPRLPIVDRLASFREVIGEMPSGCGEAQRCLSCGTCTGCDNCYVYCPEPAISRDNGVYRIDLDYCKGCGICFEECPRGIIDMVQERL